VSTDAFDERAHAELVDLEDRLSALDPDDVEVSTAAGVLRLDLRDGTRVVINSHRAAGQIWMAAVSTAWHFDPLPDGRWHASRTGEDLRPTLTRLLQERLGLAITL
jgi:CyaY protein